jgi:hypothetical protein
LVDDSSCLGKNVDAKGCLMSSVYDRDPAACRGDLGRFRREFYACLSARADALFELADAVLCADGPVRSLVELSLVGAHRRGHGALYAALDRGEIDVVRLRRALTSVPMPRAADGRLVLAADVTCWLRPAAHTSPERIMCHTYGRGKGQAIMIPGWPYSVIVALETGRSSWTAPLDAVRLAPGMDTASVTAGQMRGVIGRLIDAGHWRPGDLDIVVVVDAGYDVPRLAFLLADLPVQVLGRMRSDRVLRRAAPPRLTGRNGRPLRHGAEFIFADPASWGEPDHTSTADTRLYGPATVCSWDRLHPRLTSRAAWHGGDSLPIIEGTLIRLEVTRLPSGAIPKPVWLWWSRVDATAGDIDRCWQTFLRRFDIEHTFRMLKQTLGWTCPKVRTPRQADRWTWLILAAYTQLRLARPIAADRRRPWEKPAPADRLTPARVRRDFRHLHTTTPTPAAAPKPSRPGPGRPPGRANTHPTVRHGVHFASTETNPPRPTKPKPVNPRPRRTG